MSGRWPVSLLDHESAVGASLDIRFEIFLRKIQCCAGSRTSSTKSLCASQSAAILAAFSGLLIKYRLRKLNHLPVRIASQDFLVKIIEFRPQVTEISSAVNENRTSCQIALSKSAQLV